MTRIEYKQTIEQEYDQRQLSSTTMMVSVHVHTYVCPYIPLVELGWQLCVCPHRQALAARMQPSLEGTIASPARMYVRTEDRRQKGMDVSVIKHLEKQK